MSEDKSVRKGKSLKRFPDFLKKKVKQHTMKLQRKKQYKQNEKDIVTEQDERGYQLHISTDESSDNDDIAQWNMINTVKFNNIDEITTKKQKNDDNNIKQYHQNQPQTLSLRETLRTTGMRQPYWWGTQSNNNKHGTKSIAIKWDLNKHISTEIIAKFYTGLDDTAGDINKIEIYSIQNLKLWKKYQHYRHTNQNQNNNINEHYVWYGTNVTNVTNDVNDICNLGFQNVDSMLFAKTSQYHYNICAQKAPENKYQYLFLCRILCNYELSGNTIEANHTDQVYPQFLIRFKRTYKQLALESECKNQEYQQCLDEKIRPQHGWRECRADNDQIYYQNEFTQQTQWERPLVMDMDMLQLDVPEMEQKAQSMSELRLLQQEISGVQLAKSNAALPVNNVRAVQPIYDNAWICSICTFAENRKSEGICSVCESPISGKIKCDHCTALNDENVKICIVCCKTISINNSNVDNPNTFHYEQNENNYNQQTDDIMDVEIVKDMERYHNRKNKKLNRFLMNAVDNKENNENIYLRDYPNDNNDKLYLMDHPNDSNVKQMHLMDHPNDNNDKMYLMDHPNDSNVDLMDNDMQCLEDWQLAQQLQRLENLDFAFDNFIRQIFSEYEAEGKEEYNECNKDKELPPIRRKQPVHGTPDQLMTLYHVTSSESGKKIRESNKMIRGNKGMFGGGIYFAQTPGDANYKAEHKGMLVTCTVYIGKCHRVEDCNGGQFTFTSLYEMGYDSVWAPHGSGQGNCEHVVFNWDQVIILSVDDYNKQ